MAPGSEADESRGVVTFDDVIERGKGVPGSALTEIEEEQCVNEACMLMFTSGTTGNPKGIKTVVLSSANSSLRGCVNPPPGSLWPPAQVSCNLFRVTGSGMDKRSTELR